MDTKNINTSNQIESIRTGNSVSSIKQDFFDNLQYIQGKFQQVATLNDYYMALAYTVRDRLMNHWVKTASTYLHKEARTICYFSAEFLIGPQLGNNINSLGINSQVKQCMDDIGLDLNMILDQEPEPGLGNGGLGRLAACYMESLATLNIPTIGYGIRYEYGSFKQDICDGWQVENTDKWLLYGNPWEVPHPELAFDIKFGGYTEKYIDNDGCERVKWIPHSITKSICYDVPVIGYKSNTANFIRLWKAEACESFNFRAFNTGDYYGAVYEKMASENITKILYPNTEPEVGKELRLKQQYFFVSSSLQDMIRIYKQREMSLEKFHNKYVIQLNDTHPAIGIAELMRLLVDENKVDWNKAWEITQKTFCYTNHTLLPEALEKWPVSLFANILPRHLEIIFEINYRFLHNTCSAFINDEEKIKHLSLIDENGERCVRMVNLACVGSYSINGVSKLHTELLKHNLLKDFYDLWPEKFNNKTNGITPRRFLLLINPRLAKLITDAIGDSWVKDLEQLRNLEKFIKDLTFLKSWDQVKHENKKDLADFVLKKTGVAIDPASLFDVQAKRIHEYKRQFLNILRVIVLYNRILHNPNIDTVPKTIFFAGKAAPDYYMAKLTIKLINAVAKKVNNEPLIKNLLKIVFVPNYSVKNARYIFPAAELSEQISTAGKEASGTGNMKFALNGALTIGTMDGANIELREEVGFENFFLFGLTAEEVFDLKKKGYKPTDYIASDAELRLAIDLIKSGHFDKNLSLFEPLINALIEHDEYMICADFASYIKCHEQADGLYKNKKVWNKMSVLNTAHIGKFSSDRAISEYCKEIWKIQPVQIEN